MKRGAFTVRSVWRRPAFAAAVLAFVSVSAPPLPARALSAFAAGIPDDVAAHGAAVGVGYNYPTRQKAEARALEECRGFRDAPPDTRALCKIVAYFDGECLAISLDPQPGTPGIGWAVGTTAELAKSQAQQNCRQTAGADRVDYCVAGLTDCDTNTPPDQ